MIRSWPYRLPRARLLLFSLVAGSSAPAPAWESAPASGPAAPSAFIEGRVLGPDGAPVAGVEVRVQSDGTVLDATTLSGADGGFRLGPVPAPGTYRLTCAL